MSQQYYYNNSQYSTPTSYAGQPVSACYAAAVAQPLTSGYTASANVRPTVGTTYNVTGTPMSSAHRSQAPVTYTYPSNATVMAPQIGGVPGQQTTIVAPSLTAGKIGTVGPSFVIANGPGSAQQNLTNNGAYTVTTSYFQQMPGQAQVQHQSMAQAAAAVAAAQQANFQVAMAAANSTRGRRPYFETRLPNFRKNTKPPGKANIDNQVFYCDVCKISCAGPQTYKEHLDGQKHKKKAGGSSILMNTDSKSGKQRQLRCELCDVICTGVDAYQAHIRGTKHQKTLKLHQRLGKPIPCNDPLVIKSTIDTNGESVSTGSGKINVAPAINFSNTAVADQSVSAVADTAVSRPVVVGADSNKHEEHVNLSSLQDKAVTPVGGEYIETTVNDNGKVIQFSCKLCSCKFNDPHAKEMHLKGRRHRMQYKKKVDPCLVVDGKVSTNRNWKLEEERIRQKQQREEYWRRRDMQSRIRDMQTLEYSNVSTLGFASKSVGMRPFDTLDDRHVIAKHNSIYPTDEELETIQSVVNACEKALRHISEILFEDPRQEEKISAEETKTEEASTIVEATKMEDIPKTEESPKKDESEKEEEPTVVDESIKNEEILKAEEAAKKEDSGKKEDMPKKEESTKVVRDKLLIGAMRVGPLAKTLLLRGEMVVSLVLLCSKWPTFSLMNKVAETLPEKVQELLPNDKLEVTVNNEYQCILVSRKKAPEMHCYVHFTSSTIREESPEGVVAVQPEDGLDRKRCLDALASLRHTKWFQAKVSHMQPCLMIIRIIRDLCQRVNTWTPLSSWAVELLTEKVVSSDPMKLSPGSALRRFFECVSSGILLPAGPGLRDPCEKEISDASAVLSAQDREDITASAQHALRLIAFRQIEKVLDMEPLGGVSGVSGSGGLSVPALAQTVEETMAANARKRRHNSDSEEEEPDNTAGLKKDKKESEQNEEEVVAKTEENCADI